MLFSKGVCVSVFVKATVPQGNALQWLVYSVFFFTKPDLSEFKSNLLETLLCTKSKQGVQIFHHAVSLSSVVLGCSKHCFQPHTSIVHFIVTEQESWPAANSSRTRNAKLDTDIREFKHNYQHDSLHKSHKSVVEAKKQGTRKELKGNSQKAPSSMFCN